MEIYAYGITQRPAPLGVAASASARHELAGSSAAGSLSGRPTGLPMLGACAPVQMSVWLRPATDADFTERTHVLTTIKRNAAAGVPPGLRCTSPPV